MGADHENVGVTTFLLIIKFLLKSLNLTKLKISILINMKRRRKLYNVRKKDLTNETGNEKITKIEGNEKLKRTIY